VSAGVVRSTLIGRLMLGVPVALAWLALARAGASAAVWRTEMLAPTGVVSPVALSFDAVGDGLLAWDGNPYSMQPPRPFAGAQVRLRGGGWSQAPELPLPAIEQLQLYGAGRAMLVGSEAVTATSGPPPPGTPPCCGGYPGTVLRVRVLHADGLANGTFGAVRALDENGSAPVSAADERGDAIVAWVHAGRYRLAERRTGGAFTAPVAFPGRALSGDPLALALNARGACVLAWVQGERLYARVRPAGRRWGSAELVLRLPAPARPVPAVKLRAAITPSGTVVLAWETASGCEGCATVLHAGAAWHALGGRWRVFALERSSIALTAPGGAVADRLAEIAPLVDSYGRVYVAWTGGLQGAPIVKLAQLTAHGAGFWTPLSDSWQGGMLDDATVGPDGALLVSWFDVSHSTSGVGPVYASLRRGSERFDLAVKLTGEDVTGGSGLVALQPLDGEAFVVSGVIVGGSTMLQISTDPAG